jgi:predicted metalloendopeptidase
MMTLAAVLCCAMSMPVLTACTDNSDNPVRPDEVVTDDKPFDFEQDMDLSTRPGDNFYRYVLGAWLDSDTPSPSYLEQNKKILGAAMAKAVETSTDPFFSVIRQQAEQSAADDSKGVALLKERLAMLEAVENADQLYAAFAKLHELGYNPLFSMKNAPNEGREVWGVVTTGAMGKTMEQVMLSGQPMYVEKYVPQYCDFLSSVGYSEERIQQISRNSIEVEKLEQKAFISSLAMVKKPEVVFTRRAPSTELMPATELVFNLMGMNYSEVSYCVDITDEQLAELLTLFANASKDPEVVAELRDYMIYKVVELDSYLLPTLNPKMNIAGMADVAVSPLKYYSYQLMTEALGRENIHRDECRDIMEQMRKMFIERVDRLEWMSSATKEQAKRKAQKMEFYIGYPDEWNEAMHPDRVEGTFLLETATQMRQYANWIARQLAGKTLDEAGWNLWLSFSRFTTDNAFYNRSTNALVILPAWLMAPRFDSSKSDAVLFACATTFGHEMCHGFDNSGAKGDAEGNAADWWMPEDKAAFKAKQQELIELYNQLEAYPGQPANGEYTLGENMADYGGVTLALELYKQRLQQQGFKGQQLDDQIRKFFIAYAHVWQVENERSLKQLQNQYLTDEHSAAHNRVNGMMRLQDDWYRLYDVKPTDKLYVAPEQRVRIW